MYLAPDGSSAEYGSILVEINKRIKRDLVLSPDLAFLYTMTQDKVGLGSPWGRGIAGPGHCQKPGEVWSGTGGVPSSPWCRPSVGDSLRLWPCPSSMLTEGACAAL